MAALLHLPGGTHDASELVEALLTIDNASFFHAANPRTITDQQLYDGITREFATWVAAARAAGIITT
ncbi:VWA domain-containing protein [Streptomyces griseoviridis]|uniref:VWA domain-containing protein n=1 Tax=Streptomyces griseoviridis TaxID=45398 RepID=UPI003450CAF2